MKFKSLKLFPAECLCCFDFICVSQLFFPHPGGDSESDMSDVPPSITSPRGGGWGVITQIALPMMHDKDTGLLNLTGPCLATMRMEIESFARNLGSLRD